MLGRRPLDDRERQYVGGSIDSPVTAIEIGHLLVVDQRERQLRPGMTRRAKNALSPDAKRRRVDPRSARVLGRTAEADAHSESFPRSLFS